MPRLRSALIVLATISTAVLAQAEPATAAAPPTATQVLSSGDSNSCVILMGGTVTCWGDGALNQTAVPGLSGVVSVSAGYQFSCALLDDATVRCWGDNSDGQLGDGTGFNSATPVAVVGLTNVTAISAGDKHTCAVLDNATARCWGNNLDGELGNATTTTSVTPVTVNGLNGVVGIASASAFTCALLVTGSVSCWGANPEGELGNGTTSASTTPVAVSGIGNAVSISALGFHACALLADTTVKCWGYNGYGEVGNGTIIDASSPVAVGGLSGVIAISAGEFHTCALLNDRTAKCWGDNTDGELGNGTTTPSSSPTSVTGLTSVAAVSAGGYATCATLTTGVARCWGDNSVGELGTGTTSPSTTPGVVSALSNATPPTPPAYTPLVPRRLLDTRPDGATVDATFVGIGTRSAGSTTELLVAGRGGVPVTAQAVVLNVTAVGPRASGFVTVWPCGQPRPNASNLNYVAGDVIPNLVAAKIGTGGKVCIYVQTATDLLTDVNGYFPFGAAYTPLVPARLLETRSGASTVDGSSNAIGLRAGGSVTELVVAGRGGVPANASAVVLNVTVTDPRAPGFVTVWPCDQDRPNASNLNYVTGDTVPNSVIAKVGAGGKVCLYTQAATHLLADVGGYFPAGAPFSPLVPSRLLETRSGQSTVDGQFNALGLRAAGSTTELIVTNRGGVPAAATAVVLNVTVTGPSASGYITVWPCGQARPLASNLNYVAGDTVPNLVISKVGTGGKVCLFAQTDTHLLADVGGYFLT